MQLSFYTKEIRLAYFKKVCVTASNTDVFSRQIVNALLQIT